MRKSSPFLIISLETCVTDDFMNSNGNLVKPTQSYTSTQTELYFVSILEITSWKARAYGIFTRVGEVSEIERVSAANE